MFEGLWNGFLACLAGVLLVSGIDDLIPACICLWSTVRRQKPSSRASALEAQGARMRATRQGEEPAAHREARQAHSRLVALCGIECSPRPFCAGSSIEKRIAIFVPCWQEADVIGCMLRHNIAAIKYRNFDFFVGTYPNDLKTTAEVRSMADIFGNIHQAMCHRPGPTSKADCLNSIFVRMEEFEIEQGVRFDTIVLHDAEDIIHPEALDIINRSRSDHEMVQMPVLPLRTGFSEMTHGVYCDEFAEFQNLDMVARSRSGAFIPSNGVGTGFSREMLGLLAAGHNGQVFDPGSLTEDYEIGVRIHAAGYRQTFIPLDYCENSWVATYEYFPRKLKSAIRQRTRWVTGIGLQCWERVGWRGRWATKYWFWRDRKGLLANPLSLLANAVSLLALLDYGAGMMWHYKALFAATWPLVVRLCCLTLGLQVLRLVLRAACVSRIYGMRFAIGVPFRAVYANLVNCCASVAALRHYIGAHVHGRKLLWQKTEHVYPRAQMLPLKRRDLLQVLIDAGYLSAQAVTELRKQLPPDVDPAQYLFKSGLVSEDLICLSLSLQCGVPAVRVNHALVRKHVLRSLPTYIEERYGLLPFDVQDGKLAVAGWLVPPANVLEELRTLTNLDIEFQLVRNSDYQALRERCYDLGLAR